MKQFSFFLLSLAAVLSMCGEAGAAPVKPEKAREMALGVFVSSPSVATRGGQPALEMVWDGDPVSTRSNDAPAFYVFNRTDAPGFVIVAGDDAAEPLLGYSFECTFRTDDMPDNIRAWFAAVRETVLGVRNRNLPARAAWQATSPPPSGPEM